MPCFIYSYASQFLLTLAAACVFLLLLLHCKTKTTDNHIKLLYKTYFCFRTRMHKDATQIIKDRRLRFRPQTSCFIGTQAIDWVIKNGLAPNRAVALRAFTILQENEVLHHGELQLHVITYGCCCDYEQVLLKQPL